LNQAGIGAYILSGDNYPHRIPKYNDAERLHIFRESGIRGLVTAGEMTKEHFELLHSWQEEETDADRKHMEEHPWMKAYLDAGRTGLTKYLGTPNETDFSEVSERIRSFKEGASSLWLRRMGRDEAALWYDEVDMTAKQVLIIEWTHGNTDCMKEVDVPVLLNSTPEETLEHRRSRARDGKVDSPFTMMVLELEQNKLMDQAHKAKIIISKAGEIISYDEYKKLMGL
jgi:alpha-galactosidase